MNDSTADGRELRRAYWLRTGSLAIVAGTVLLATACTAGSSPGSSATSSPGSSASNSSSPKPTTSPQKDLSFVNCMRSHGVNLPNLPAPSGAPSGAPAGTPASGRANKIGGGTNPQSPQFQAAMQACGSLAPQAQLP